MAEINARALMFNLGREDAIDSTTSAKIARYAERKQLAYKRAAQQCVDDYAPEQHVGAVHHQPTASHKSLR